MDTREDPIADARLKAFWSRVGVERLGQGRAGQFSYNVFGVSQADLARIRELHLGYFRSLRAIVASSTGAEHVVVANVQLFTLDGGWFA